jgi:replicative superfamily II helicase
MASRQPIESKFANYLFDNLNAEISATGTVSNIDEAVQWLGYTYLFIRMQRNPLVYGLQSWNNSLDPNLVQHRRELCISAARKLAANQMIAFDETTGYFTPKDTGRIASSYYLRLDSVEVFNKALHPRCSEADVLGVVSCSHEFDGIKVRDEELRELDKLVSKGACPCAIKVKPPL